MKRIWVIESRIKGCTKESRWSASRGRITHDTKLASTNIARVLSRDSGSFEYRAVPYVREEK
jgi:hypothetical protein